MKGFEVLVAFILMTIGSVGLYQIFFNIDSLKSTIPYIQEIAIFLGILWLAGFGLLYKKVKNHSIRKGRK